MRTTYWTIWTREPEYLRQQFPAARFLRWDQIQPGVAVLLLENADPDADWLIRRATNQFVAEALVLHCARSWAAPDHAGCYHSPDASVHHYERDEWIVTDDRLHQVVNIFKADCCGVLEKYDDVDVLRFDDGQAARSEVQRRIAAYQVQDGEVGLWQMLS
jgi:hypothetical protein